MRWEGREGSSNVEDRRGFGRKGIALGGVGGVIALIIAAFLGVDPRELPLPSQSRVPQSATAPTDPAEDKLAAFTRVIFRDTEIVWGEQFRRIGDTYKEPTLVLYDGVVQSACGSAQSAVGPFYCPGDAKVYIDLSFYRDMERKLEATGDFARAYVIAHEVGHHVQRLLGYSRRPSSNQESVQLELQADYLAGVWAHHAEKKFTFLEPGDVEEAIGAAEAVGDDKLQQRSRGYVVPDSFTHGTSRQRAHWFMEGFRSGDVAGAARVYGSVAE